MVKSWMAAGLWLVSAVALAGELAVNVSVQGRPLKGLDVELDGATLGRTGDLGELIAEVEPGRYTLKLVRNAIELGDVPVEIRSGERLTLAVQFQDFSRGPQVQQARARLGEGGVQEAPGNLLATVTDPDGQPLPGATLTIEPVGSTVETNAQGVGSLALPGGVYALKVSHPQFGEVEQENVRIPGGLGVAVAVRFPGSAARTALRGAPSEAVDEIVVVGTFRAVEDPIQIERAAVTIVSAISFDDLIRLGDGDLASGLRRLVGVSITGGRYAVVRGLDGRYISTTINRARIPSTDPYRRDIQLDLFPTDLVQSLEISKTFSADLPGDSTGGNIQIITKGRDIEEGFKLGVSLGATSGVTGRDRLTYRGGGRDRFGFDDGTRRLPASARELASPTNPGAPRAVAEQATRELPNIFNTRTETAPFDLGLSAAYGRRFDLTGGKLAVSLAGGYDQESSRHQDGLFAPDFGLRVSPELAFNGTGAGTFTEESARIKLNAYGVALYESASGWTLDSKTYVLRDTEDAVRVVTAPSRAEPANRVDATTLEWIERSFIGQQFSFVMPMFDGRDQWTSDAAIFRAERSAPDRRRYEFVNDALNSLQRFYSDVSETMLFLGSRYDRPFEWASWSAKAAVGVDYSTGSRTADVFTLGLSPGFSAADGQDVEVLVRRAIDERGAVYRINTQPTDPYEADQQQAGLFMSLEATRGAWTLIPGLRVERYTLDLEYPFDAFETERFENIRETDLLPSLAATLQLTPEQQVRAAYSRTVSRPNITERARSAFFDDQDRFILGCAPDSDCVTATINSFDLRWERYPEAGGNLSVAAFYKRITDPLELALATRTADVRALQYRNNKAATLIGLEFDGSRQWTFEGWSLDLGGNLALIDSEVDLDAQAQQIEGISSRRLQGQSRYLVNGRVGVEFPAWRQNLTLSVNHFGDRIAGLGLNTEPFLLEKGRSLVNLVHRWDATERLALRTRLQNLLDAPVEFTQGGLLMERHRLGVGFSTSLSYAFE